MGVTFPAKLEDEPSALAEISQSPMTSLYFIDLHLLMTAYVPLYVAQVDDLLHVSEGQQGI